MCQRHTELHIRALGEKAHMGPLKEIIYTPCTLPVMSGAQRVLHAITFLAPCDGHCMHHAMGATRSMR